MVAILEKISPVALENQDYYAHPTAFLDEGCQVGAGSKIWHFCHLMSGSRIGKDCILGQNCFVASKVNIGDGVKIQNNVSVYEGVNIEDDVFLGPSMVFTNVIRPRAFIEQKEAFLPTLVKKGASIGANATVICGNTIGQYAFVAAGAVVNKDVPDFGFVAGVPGELKGFVSRNAQKLTFDDTGIAKCPQTGEVYRMIEGKVKFIES
jgi:UDP-2-acetamido-3-amino-2,3-dideoxy-glucuronate N-acetyltransferase